MNRDAMIEALARVINDKMPPTSGMDETPADIAAAVLDLCGPEPLVWQRNGNHWAGGRGYVVRQQFPRYVLTIRNQFDQYFDALEAAQAAAQDHATAAHWANTPLGKLVQP